MCVWGGGGGGDCKLSVHLILYDYHGNLGERLKKQGG